MRISTRFCDKSIDGLHDHLLRSTQQNYAGIALTGMELTSLLYLKSKQKTIAIVAYEYVITFHQEIATVWRRPLNLTSLLLLSTRYTAIVSQLLSWLPGSPAVCTSHLYYNS